MARQAILVSHMTLSPYPILAYHGCDDVLAQDIIAGRAKFSASNNDYDWLGGGIYFWIGSYRRAAAWANYKFKAGKIGSPGIVSALIDLKHCLNLADFGTHQELRAAYDDLSAIFRAAGIAMPVNYGGSDPLVPTNRCLDCAVIDHIHVTRARNGHRPYDTVIGAFDEGGPAYPGGSIWRKSHIQLVVRNPACLVRLF